MNRNCYKYKIMAKTTDTKCFLYSNFAHCSLLSRVSQFSDWDVDVAVTSSTFTRKSMEKNFRLKDLPTAVAFVRCLGITLARN